mmetsp:Transcript_10119/g.29918  ORF Transcript_10119/g.29918 Transcript_10119/m.29918 type:complete len:92 (-) Transcript_10119:899-1174(-)
MPLGASFEEAATDSEVNALQHSVSLWGVTAAAGTAVGAGRGLFPQAGVATTMMGLPGALAVPLGDTTTAAEAFGSTSGFSVLSSTSSSSSR